MAEIKRYLTPVFRLSFPALFESQSYDGGPEKYGLSAVWTPSKFTDKDKRLFREILSAMSAESESRFKKPLKELPPNYKRGIRDGGEKADLEGYGEGTRFANISSKMRPGVVDADRAEISPEEGNAEEIYPGCYCRATVTVYSYDNKGKGVALGLMNVQKITDGGRLDSRTDASEDFEEEVDGAWLDEDEDQIDDEFLG
ncbi:MAG: ssDNA-binding protein [Thermoplasmata archaeon]